MDARTRRACAHLVMATAVMNSALWGRHLLLEAGPRWAVHLAKEDTLREDLRVLRKMIDQYTGDMERAPRTLDDLVTERYLPAIPEDPMTGTSETWEVVLEDEAIARDGQRGIIDVKSGSTTYDGSGHRRYCDW